jgi:hypothetical protein
MKLHTQKPIRNSYLRGFAIGLVSLIGISASPLLNYVKPVAAQTIPSASQYIVYSPNVANLRRARTIAPDAFLSRLNSGEQVVQLGRFNNLNLAERRAAEFNRAGLTAQVRPVSGQFSNLPAPIPSNPPVTSLPTPVGSLPINEPLPGVPGADFPSNSIEIVRSPQPIPQQPLPVQTLPVAVANPSPSTGTPLRYFVIIPTGLVSELQRVQAIVPTAQLRSSYRGTYIEVQGYPDRGSAETLNGTIRRQGFDSRVVFF